MGPSARAQSARFRVLLYGKAPGSARGVDLDEQGRGTVTSPRLYQLIRQWAPVSDRRFEIEFARRGRQGFRVHVRLIRRRQSHVETDRHSSPPLSRHRRHDVGRRAARPSRIRERPARSVRVVWSSQADQRGVVERRLTPWRLGPSAGPAVLLLHGWPYDIHSYVDVWLRRWPSAGYRVIVPYLRGYGIDALPVRATRSGMVSNRRSRPTSSRSWTCSTSRKSILAGFDWGARDGRRHGGLGLEALQGDRLGERVSRSPISRRTCSRCRRRAELGWWYQYYFATERGPPRLRESRPLRVQQADPA